MNENTVETFDYENLKTEKLEWENIPIMFEFYKHKSLDLETVKTLETHECLKNQSLKVICCVQADSFGAIADVHRVESINPENTEDAVLFIHSDHEVLRQVLFNFDTYKKSWFIFKD